MVSISNLVKLLLDSNLIQGFVAAPVRCILLLLPSSPNYPVNVNKISPLIDGNTWRKMGIRRGNFRKSLQPWRKNHQNWGFAGKISSQDGLVQNSWIMSPQELNFSSRSELSIIILPSSAPTPTQLGAEVVIFSFNPTTRPPGKVFFATMKHNLEKQSCKTKWADPKTVNRPNPNPKNILLF